MVYNSILDIKYGFLMGNYIYLCEWHSNTRKYNLWHFTPEEENILSLRPVNSHTWRSFSSSWNLIPIANYIITWDLSNNSCYYWKIDIPNDGKGDIIPGSPVQGNKLIDITKEDKIIPLGNFLLKWNANSGNYSLYPFNPQNSYILNYGEVRGQLNSMQHHELIPIENYVLFRNSNSINGEIQVYGFDPQDKINPFKNLIQTDLTAISNSRSIIPIGNYLLDIDLTSKDYNLWRLNADNYQQPLFTQLRHGVLDDQAWSSLNQDTVLFAINPKVPLSQLYTNIPGTIGFMRSKIKKIVYYMLENRSLDHVCGWLYENDIPSNFVGGNKFDYDGSNTNNYNLDSHRNKIFQSKYNKGNADSTTSSFLEFPTYGPGHDHANIMAQMFGPRYDIFYQNNISPSMGGYVIENKSEQTMQGFTPNQLTVLNGLAKSFSISDRWFCSFPGSTDNNRGFSLTGSCFGLIHNFESGYIYNNWPNVSHRCSIWDTLWSYGVTDWKIYHYSDWDGFCYTSQLFLKKHIKEVDEDIQRKTAKYVDKMEQFFLDAKNGTLPSFSFIETSWLVGNDGNQKVPANSYHPVQDLVRGESDLNKIYEALRDGPDWENTLFVISFDENGGLYDHVPPPRLNNPYRGDKVLDDNGADHIFGFDLLGVRVPTILVSPWIHEKTVFRPFDHEKVFDSTSFLATLLKWYGIEEGNWWLGERIKNVPTFESVFTLTQPRTDKPSFSPARNHEELPLEKIQISDLHATFIERLIWHLGDGILTEEELNLKFKEIMEQSQNLGEALRNIHEYEKILALK